MYWEILAKKNKNIVKTLLKNRGIENEKEFFDPKIPEKLDGVKFDKALERIKQAKKNKEKVIVYGDYDADGICATAIMWEALYGFGLDVLPHIPDRFDEGYGLNAKTVHNLKLKIENLKLIVTVDNGIVAYEGIKKAKELGIDVIVVDHHQKGKLLPSAYCLIHSVLVSGSALAYFFAKELITDHQSPITSLELAAIGTIADQMPLTGVNRSLVKHGLKELENSKRLGLRALFEGAKIESVGTYEVNYMIAPRINAMGRISHGLDSLRLLCTKSPQKAKELSMVLGRTNFDRQKIVDEVVLHARGKVTDQKIIILAHESYHEGVIGLAAGKLVEEFYRPAIVLSKKGDVSKASARSISGFNIIEAIRETDLILEGGGHPMAAGFSIETSKIEIFSQKINKIADELLTDELLERKLKIDTELDFKEINPELVERIKTFEPFGLGNPTPTFMSKNVEVIEARPVGRDGSHLKLKLKQNSIEFDAIWFNASTDHRSPMTDHQVDVVYQIEDNTWNNHKSLQLKIKDIILK